MRVRTTAAAVLVVAVALVAGSVALTALLRDSLLDGLETTAEQRASALADRVSATGPPPTLGEPLESDERPDDEGPDDEGPDDEGPDDGPRERAEERRDELRDRADDLDEEILEQVAPEEGGDAVATTGLTSPLPLDDARTTLPGLPGDWVVATDDAEGPDGVDYVASVAVPAREVDDSTAALAPLLGLGVPAVLLVVGLTTWVVVGRALAPVERIRREVDAIGGEALHRRVPVPAARDEVHALAETMNRMLGRLEDSAVRQRRFVSDASHELRSPLASLRQTAEVARSHPGAMPDGELAEATWEETLRMQRLVDQLLVLTRSDEGRRVAVADVDLDDLVLAEASRLRRLGTEVDASEVAPVRVRGEETALAQVVRNLADNAARHASGRVALGCGLRGGRAVVWVDDDGSGVPEEERERVFERFVRLDEARSRDAGGSGLGLAIVRETAARHQGTSHVEPSPLGGARFVVALPPAHVTPAS